VILNIRLDDGKYRRKNFYKYSGDIEITLDCGCGLLQKHYCVVSNFLTLNGMHEYGYCSISLKIPQAFCLLIGMEVALNYYRIVWLRKNL